MSKTQAQKHAEVTIALNEENKLLKSELAAYKEHIRAAIDDLPQSPDSAKSYLEHALPAPPKPTDKPKRDFKIEDYPLKQETENG